MKLPSPATDHALVYASRTPHNRRSAVTFASTVALAPATVLLGGALPVAEGRRLATALNTGQLVDFRAAKDRAAWPELQRLELRVVSADRAEDEAWLRQTTARILFVFNCASITEALVDLLDGFEQATTVGKLAKSFDLGPCALSSFVVLQIDNSETGVAIAVLQSMSQLAASGESDRPNGGGVLNFRPVHRLDRVATVTTPFTNEVFFRTINVGRVANHFGRRDCLFVVSQALVAGCDGGAVYNQRLELVGIIISTVFSWKNVENASMTLVASFAVIVADFLRQTELCEDLRVVQINRNLALESSELMAKCVLLIDVGESSGSGCFVQVQQHRFILTCSHVVANTADNSTITCHWRGGRFTTRLLYKNPRFGRAYDIAVLHAPDANTVPDDHFTRMAEQRVRVGQRVFAAGFPHFFALATRQFAPSLQQGRVSKVAEHMLQTDASIQAGQSGGPLLAADGRLVGVMVSNTRETDGGRIYPHVNMCIPIAAIAGVVEEFVASGDRMVLERLEASDEVARSWNLQADVVLSKL